MGDAVEIMDELRGLDGELKSFPSEAHWFCPRQNDDDPVDYSHPDEAEEDMSSETKLELIKDSRQRHKAAYRYSLVLGLDQDQDVTVQLVEDYVKKLNRLLGACDKCVYNYHLGRKAYLKELAETFDDDAILALSSRLTTIDIARIDRGLKSAEKIFASEEPHKRTQSLLATRDSEALLALYESLCCADYHKSQGKLAQHFDYVFTQAQSKKVLKIGDILPAMARFLFDPDPLRRRFAETAWQIMETPLTAATFEWVVHDVLLENISNFRIMGDEGMRIVGTVEEKKRFWQGFLLILGRIDEKLLVHSLNAMESQPNLYLLLFWHLTGGSKEVIALVIRVIRSLLQKSPKSFWDHMGTTSPAIIAEQILANADFHSLLKGSGKEEISSALEWIPPFMSSIQTINQSDACRSLLRNLLEHLQTDQFPPSARMACCEAGLGALCITLGSFTSSKYTINPSTSLIVISDVLSLVNSNIDTISGCADLADGEAQHHKLKKLGVQVIKDALTLDCKAMSAEYYALELETRIQRVPRDHSQGIWEATLKIFRPGNLELAGCILSSSSILIGLDKLWPRRRREPLDPGCAQYNKDFQELNDNISRVFERLSDFDPEDLKKLCQNPETARPLFGGLVSADQAVYEAAVEVVKTLTGQSDKADAMQDLLEQAFTPALHSINFAVNRISKSHAFSPVPYMLKIGKDLLMALCDSTGVLRTRHTLTASEQTAVMAWWTIQWKALDSVFKSTEVWATRVTLEMKQMEDFCRDAMEYADALFDKYTIIATAVGDSSPLETDRSSMTGGSSKESIQKVLTVVCDKVNGLTLMLRLRDHFLIAIITRILTKLLRCLSEYDVEIDEVASDFIQSACRRENDPKFKKTNLDRQQKADLQRALDEHQGRDTVIDLISPVAGPKKQQRLDSWSKSADGKRHEPSYTDKKDPFSSLQSQTARNRALLERNKAGLAKPAQNQAFLAKRKQAEEERQRVKDEAVAKAKALRAPSAIVKGEGSGIQGIGGFAGKDHAPVRSEIMVDSSEEDSSSSDDGEDDGGILSKNRKATSKIVTEYEESRRLARLKPTGPVRKTKVQRSAKDLRARVEPNMDGLYLEILDWDIFHNGDTPPSKNQCRKIDDRYLDLTLYKNTFGPLLISEVWRSLVTAKEENNFKPIEVKVLNRLSVDKFMEVSISMPIATKRDLQLSERDIVLISRSAEPLNDPQEPHCLARVDKASRKKGSIEITLRVSRGITASCLQCLVPNGKIFALKIADMTTTQREFAALSSLEYYDLCNEVLEARPSPLQKYSTEKVAVVSKRYNLNQGQAKAILSADDNDGFTLIQGPPGSGKTKTIIAMVGALMTATLAQQQEEQGKARPQAQPQGVSRPAAVPPKKKLLICAPSNAAVDELVVRLKEGIQPINGPRQKINVIRIGRSDAINTSVKDVMLDELVRIKLEGDNGAQNKLVQDRDKLHQDAAKIKERLGEVRPLMEAARGAGDKATELKLQREFDELKRNQARIGNKIDEDKESGNTFSRQNEINRRRFQQEIIDGAHVLCATLSGSGHDMFRGLNVEFETVIIDEAAQCIELSALIPLKYGCNKCILVGDPEQLPPTVLSRAAQSFGYEQSLFVRMQRNHPNDVHLLDTQYRMHPEISSFPSQQFYHGRLVDGQGMAELRAQPWHASSILGPYRFFDVKGVQTKEARGHSFINIPELDAAMKLYERLKTDYRQVDFKGKLGIITSYKAQLNELKIRFARKYGDGIFEEIEFNTTDAFQGREREIIIFSCVRAKATGGIGFLGDIRRMNVGLTRAKSSLWVLGDSRSLQQGEFWNKLIEDAKARERYTGGDVIALFSRPTARDAPVVKITPRVVELKEEEDSDVEMVDADASMPVRSRDSISGDGAVKKEEKSRSSSIISLDSTDVKREHKGANHHFKHENSEVVGDQENRTPSLSSAYASSGTTATGLGINAYGKRPREPPTVSSPVELNKPTKLKPLHGKPAVKDLDAALTAQEATKAAQQPSRPPPPAGVMPPRKRAPADPFIQRKKPQRRT